jgi:hypothetical protein
MLEWLIVGGGIHGTFMSNYLMKTRGADRTKLCVVDPHDEPLSVWKRCTRSTAMNYLRSPAAHNLDVGTGALLQFARNHDGRGEEFYSKHRRPSLHLFNSHCDHVVEKGGLTSFRLQASALSIERSKHSYILNTTGGELHSKRIILCLGSADRLSIPEWASQLEPLSAPIVHVFSTDFAHYKDKKWTRAVVIGGGISAAQLALALSLKSPGNVTMLHSKRLQIYPFDTEPCWLDERCLRHLRRQPDYAERRSIVDRARYWGSFPADVGRQLNQAIQNRALACLNSSVISATGDANGVSMMLSDGSILDSDLVVFATGFERSLPGGDFLRNAIQRLGLPCAPCGFPILDEYLRWSEGLYATGALAELVIGPASRNIVGARMASQRIAKGESPPRNRPKELDYYYYRRRRSS